MKRKQKPSKYPLLRGILFSFLKTNMMPLSILIITILCSTLLSLVSPLLTKMLIDNVLIDRNMKALCVVVSGFLIVFAMDNVNQICQSRIRIKLETKLTFKIQLSCLSSAFSVQSYSRMHISNGDVFTRIDQDAASFASTLIGATMQIIQLVMLFVSSFYLILRFNVLLSFTVLAILPVIYLVVRRFGPSLESANRAVVTEHSDVAGFLSDIMEKKMVLFQNHAFSFARSRFARKERKLLDKIFFRYRTNIVYSTLLSGLFFLPSIIVYGLGGVYVIVGSLTIGELIAFTNYLSYIFAPFQSMTGLHLQYRNMMVVADRLEELLSVKLFSPVRLSCCDNAEDQRYKVSFSKATFSYDVAGEVPVFTDFSFEVLSGEMVLLIGANGAGKTTITNIICGLLPCQKYIVSYPRTGGKDRVEVGVVPYAAQLVEGSVRDNILLGFSIDDTAILGLGAELGFLSLLKKYPLDYPVSIRNNVFSEGERKKVAIMRALIRNPMILISDEGESSLDRSSCDCFREYLIAHKADRITIVISHDSDAMQLPFDRRYSL